VGITDENEGSIIKVLWEECDPANSKCRSGTKCGPVFKKDVIANGQIPAARLQLLQTKTKWGKDMKTWEVANADVDSANICVPKLGSELSDELGYCTGVADCKTGFLCDMDQNKCVKNAGARIATADDVSMTTWTSEAQIPTCQTDVECTPGTYCQMTQNPNVSICAPASKDFVTQAYGTCFVSEALGSDKKSIVPRIDATKSTCKPNTAMTVNWKDPQMNCACCTMTADPSKKRCGEASPIMPYGQVLQKGLADASQMF
jgi:hypothetical protein